MPDWYKLTPGSASSEWGVSFKQNNQQLKPANFRPIRPRENGHFLKGQTYPAKSQIQIILKRQVIGAENLTYLAVMNWLFSNTEPPILFVANASH